MFTSSETPIIGTILLVVFAILGWGLYRARPFGKLGILAWLQSVVLMAPWLLFFGLFAAGIYINIVGVLFLVVASAGLYIALGKRLRSEGQETILRQRATQRLAADSLSEAENATESAVVSDVVPIPEADLSAIRSIFGIDTFFATETIAYQDGAIFKGNLRGKSQEVHSRLTQSLQEKLDNKYRLFLVENTDGKPVVIVLPSSNDPRPTTLAQKAFAGILLIATIAASLETAGLLLNFDFFDNPARFTEVLPIGAGIITILVAHEIGHWILARRYQVRLSWPFLFTCDSNWIFWCNYPF